MTRDEIKAIAQGVAPAIKAFVGKEISAAQLSIDDLAEAFDKVYQRIEPLERELAELKSRGTEYKGVYQRALPYRHGSLVTFDGSMFAAVRDVKEGEAPKNSDGWQLAIKSGRDAR